ncbi:MAG: hypothetical protein V3W18_06995 [candidate division Zixibacteria bacterium]
MGAVRWTAKGMIFVGKLLEAKEVEEYLEKMGSRFITDKLQQLPVKWLAGQTRAKKQVLSDIRKSVDKSDTFRTALTAAVEKLPYVILQISEYIRKNGPDALILRAGFSTDIVVCPRGAVKDYYVNLVTNELKDSAELSRYEGLPLIFLERITRQSEHSFFYRIADSNYEILPGNSDMIIGVDDDFGWNIDGIDGHYYVGGRDSYGTDLSKRRQRKALLKDIEKMNKTIKIELGKLPQSEISNVVKRLSAN